MWAEVKNEGFVKLELLEDSLVILFLLSIVYLVLLVEIWCRCVHLMSRYGFVILELVLLLCQRTLIECRGNWRINYVRLYHMVYSSSKDENLLLFCDYSTLLLGLSDRSKSL